MTPATVERLPNGFTTAVCEVPGRHQVLITLLVRAGSRFETPAQSGISHFVEHLLFRGSEAWPDAFRLNAAFEQVGSMPNAVTGVEDTEIYLLAHPDRLESALEILADMVRHPRFLDLEKERGIIHDEILYDYNDKGELIHLGALAAQLLWPGHQLGQLVTGTLESLGSFDEQTARSHHATHYVPQNMVLGLCGGIAAEQGFALAKACFGDWSATGQQAEAPPAPAVASGLAAGAEFAAGADSVSASGLAAGAEHAAGAEFAAGACAKQRTRLVHDSDNQFHLQLSFPAPGYNSPEAIFLMLLARVLDDGPNTRLQRQIREDLALAYHVGAEYTGFQDVGQLDITTSVKAERLEAVLEALVRCLLNFREDGPTAQELDAARQRHRLDLHFSQDSLDARVERYVWPLLYSTPVSFAEELERVEQASPETLRRLAGEVLAPARLHLALVGPVDDQARKLVESALVRFQGAMPPR